MNELVSVIWYLLIMLAASAPVNAADLNALVARVQASEWIVRAGGA